MLRCASMSTVALATIAAALIAAGPLPTDDPVLAPEGAPRATPTTAAPAPVQGMTVSCHGAGRVWGTDAMVETMRELKALGVNWIAIHPYAGIRSDGTVPMSDDWYGTNTSWLTRPIAEAHALGLQIMIKPHIAYWGSEFGWRGEIEFTRDEHWERFFQTYEAWITRVAEIAKDADAFVVGTELDRTLHYENRWRDVIRRVRDITDAPLTYSGELGLVSQGAILGCAGCHRGAVLLPARQARQRPHRRGARCSVEATARRARAVLEATQPPGRAGRARIQPLEPGGPGAMGLSNRRPRGGGGSASLPHGRAAGDRRARRGRRGIPVEVGSRATATGGTSSRARRRCGG